MGAALWGVPIKPRFVGDSPCLTAIPLGREWRHSIPTHLLPRRKKSQRSGLLAELLEAASTGQFAAARFSLARKCGITCSPKRRMVVSTSSCAAGPTAQSKIISSIPSASYNSIKRMHSAGVPTQNCSPRSRTSRGVGSSGYGPAARR
jgi:hypothetical protein